MFFFGGGYLVVSIFKAFDKGRTYDGPECYRDVMSDPIEETSLSLIFLNNKKPTQGYTSYPKYTGFHRGVTYKISSKVTLLAILEIPLSCVGNFPHKVSYSADI